MDSTVADDVVSRPPTEPAGRHATDRSSANREVCYEHSRNFVAVLEQIGVSLLVTTYQAGKLFVVGTQDGSLSLSFHNFERAMDRGQPGKDRGGHAVPGLVPTQRY
jgi:hypothetical protein